MVNIFSPESELPYFVGRSDELFKLKECLIKKHQRIAIISGNNATGKTSLWQFFIRSSKIFNEKIQVFNYSRQFEGFPDIEKQTKLIIIDDLSYEFNKNLEIDIQKVIKDNPKVQFILVGALVNNFKNLNPDLTIHLDNFPYKESSLLLKNLLNSNLSENEIQKIANYAKGNPYILKLFIYYINQRRYTVEQIVSLISDKIYQKGVFRNNGIEILSSSPEYKAISSDIKIVNKSILDRIKLRPEDMYRLTSRQFEEMVAELMERRGYKVDLTKATRDGGKDLIIANHMDIGNFIYYLECKNYAQENPVGVKLIRELVGTVYADRVTAGIMITSSYFSPDAIEYSEKIKNQISLIDYIKLNEWLKKI